ncbi:MAG: hypothetical protein GY847_03305 [Proteobacteria bacterium]|nr:hypothetical protein [Pseudomonadota bacterium]
MRRISAEEWQLISFFEVEPQRRDPSSPWEYDDSVYVVTDGDITLSCAIHPAYRDVRLILSARDKQIYEFDAMGVRDVTYIKKDGEEKLLIVVSEDEVIYLQTRPSIKISQHIEVGN